MTEPEPVSRATDDAPSGLKAKLAAGRSSVGILVRMPSETLVELSGVAGMDFVLIDCEHGPADHLALRNHIASATLLGLDVLVRVGRDDSDDILRVLELGAVGIVVPHVDSAAQARAAVYAAHFPPLGDRGFAQYGRAGLYGVVPAAEQLARARADTVVVVMIETEQGVAAAEDILACEGVDAVMAGPADLSVSMGLTGGVDEPSVRAAVAHIGQAARAHGRYPVTVVGGVEQARTAPTGLIVYNIAKVLVSTFRTLTDGAAPTGGDTDAAGP